MHDCRIARGGGSDRPMQLNTLDRLNVINDFWHPRALHSAHSSLPCHGDDLLHGVQSEQRGPGSALSQIKMFRNGQASECVGVVPPFTTFHGHSRRNNRIKIDCFEHKTHFSALSRICCMLCKLCFAFPYSRTTIYVLINIIDKLIIFPI